MRVTEPPLIIRLTLVLVTAVLGFFALREIFLIIHQGPSIESQAVGLPVVSASGPIGEKREVSPYSPATAYSPVELGMQSSRGWPEGQRPLRPEPLEDLSSLRDLPMRSLRSESESIIDGSLRTDEDSSLGGGLRALPMGSLRSEEESIIDGNLRTDEDSLPRGSLRE